MPAANPDFAQLQKPADPSVHAEVRKRERDAHGRAEFTFALRGSGALNYGAMVSNVGRTSADAGPLGMSLRSIVGAHEHEFLGLRHRDSASYRYIALGTTIIFWW